MKALQIASRDSFKIVLMIFLIASLAFATVPRAGAVQGQASISVEKNVSISALPRVTFGIDKSVNNSSIILNPGESSEVVYTINVTRTEATETSYRINGTITATNDIRQTTTATVTMVEDAVEYHAGGSSWPEVRRVEVFSGETFIKPGDSKLWAYDFTFAAPAGTEDKTWHNVAYVTVSNAGGIHENQPYRTEAGFVLPGPASVSNEVKVFDEEGLDPDDVGISYEVTSVAVDDVPSSDLVGPWTVTPPAVIKITKRISAAANATPGVYEDILHNVASIEGGPSDSEDVDVEVKGPVAEQQGGGGGQPSGGGGGGGGTTEQAATVTTEAVPAPVEQVAVAPEVVSQPSAPQLVAQAPAAKQLPFTGLDSWYIYVALILIATGSLLQLVRSRPQHLRK